MSVTDGAAISFITRYQAYRMYAELGFTNALSDLDPYDAEAFGLIYLSFKKAERDLAKRRK